MEVVISFLFAKRSRYLRGGKESPYPDFVRRFNLVLFASTAVCCAGRPAACYWAAREALPRVPTAFQGSKCMRGEGSSCEESIKLRHSRVNRAP